MRQGSGVRATGEGDKPNKHKSKRTRRGGLRKSLGSRWLLGTPIAIELALHAARTNEILSRYV
jgi:hypothetical protein